MMLSKRGLAAAGRPEQRIGAAILPFDVELLQRPVLGAARPGAIAVLEVLQRDPGHQRTGPMASLHGAISFPSASKYMHSPTSR